jgi:hypothetical protein
MRPEVEGWWQGPKRIAQLFWLVFQRTHHFSANPTVSTHDKLGTSHGMSGLLATFTDYSCIGLYIAVQAVLTLSIASLAFAWRVQHPPPLGVAD